MKMLASAIVFAGVSISFSLDRIAAAIKKKNDENEQTQM